MHRLILATIFLCSPLQAQFSFSDNDKALEIHFGGQLVSAFHSDGRFPYLYPAYSPSGANVLRTMPLTDIKGKNEDKDHPHHKGIWLTHGSVNGYDFWLDETKLSRTKSLPIKGSPTIRTDSIDEKLVDKDAASFSANLTWVADNKDLLKEVRRYRFSKPNPETVRIDIESTLTAIADSVVFGDTKEGTFALRTDRTLRVQGRIAKATLTNSNGETNLDAWGKKAGWAAYSGPDDLGKPAVVAIIEHPDSFRSPTHWHARDYGLLAANPFGIHDFEMKPKEKTLGNHELKKNESIKLSYSVIIHHGTLESAKLNDILNSLKTP